VSGLLTATLNGDSIYKFTVHDTGGTPVLSGLTQIATGLRNAAGIAIDPKTGNLYFTDNGIDDRRPGGTDRNVSVDELNRIPPASIGGPAKNFGFPHDYIEAFTGNHIGSGGEPPLATFQPVGGSISEGPAEIAISPSGFPQGLNNGVFIGFHGKDVQGGLANDENPLVYYDFDTGKYFHFISNDEPNIGHPDGLLATDNALFISDLYFDNFQASGTGKIYEIRAQITAVPEPPTFVLLTFGMFIFIGYELRRRLQR
jgi:glucose/arabinose dehydrogenase